MTLELRAERTLPAYQDFHSGPLQARAVLASQEGTVALAANFVNGYFGGYMPPILPEESHLVLDLTRITPRLGIPPLFVGTIVSPNVVLSALGHKWRNLPCSPNCCAISATMTGSTYVQWE